MKIVSKVKLKNLRKELDVVHEKLTLYRILDGDRGKLPEPKVEELTDNGSDASSTTSTTLDKSKVHPLRVLKLCATFQDEINLYLVTENLLERGGKEVWEFCRTFGLESHIATKYTFYQICKAVEQTHYFQILHRDLKPENMFYTPSRSYVKLIDFGSSIMIDERELRVAEIDKHPKRNKFSNFVGTPQFMAPEWIHNKETTFASDVWSLGCILYQLYWGITWFRGGSEYLIFLKSTEADYQYPASLQIIPQEARDLIDQIIKINPEERISLNDLLKHSYFDEVRDKFEFPDISSEEQSLVEIKQDILKRYKVYKFDAQEKFVETITQNIKDKVGEEYFKTHSQYIEHIVKLGKNYVFDIEWDFGEKNEVEITTQQSQDNKPEKENVEQEEYKNGKESEQKIQEKTE
jgi:serine/threonine protein kinase